MYARSVKGATRRRFPVFDRQTFTNCRRGFFDFSFHHIINVMVLFGKVTVYQNLQIISTILFLA